MPAFAWQRRVWQAAHERGWLASGLEPKLLWLLEQGLHLEQVLLGTGLLTATRYAELAEALWGFSLARLDQDRFARRAVAEPLPGNVAPAVTEDGQAVWLVADPWEEAVQPWLARSEPGVPVFRSDLLRWRRRPEASDLAVSAWWRVWQRSAATTEALLFLDRGQGAVTFGSTPAFQPDLACARAELPALQTWFEAGLPRQTWQARRLPRLEADAMQLVARHDGHPAAGFQGWQTFLERPQGILVCVAPDAWLRERLAPLRPAAALADLFSEGGLARVEPQTPAEREWAAQAALAGANLCWLEEAPGDLGWFRPLAKAGVRVTVVRARPTPHGTAWETYLLAYE